MFFESYNKPMSIWEQIANSQQQEIDPITGYPYASIDAPLPMLPNSPQQIIEQATTPYENVTAEIKKRRQIGLSKDPDYDEYLDVNKAGKNEDGSWNDPYTERRFNPLTNEAEKQYIVQRDDKEWIALTPTEYENINKSLEKRKIDPDKIQTLAKSQDIYEQLVQQPTPPPVVPSTSTPSNPNIQPPSVVTPSTSTPVTSTTTPPSTSTNTPVGPVPPTPIPVDPVLAQSLQAVDELKGKLGPGEKATVPIGMTDAYNQAIKNRQVFEDAKKAKYDALVQEAQQYNQTSDMKNLTRQGYVAGTPEETTPEFRAKYGDHSRNSSGNRGLYAPTMDMPDMPEPSPMPEIKTANISYEAKQPFQPQPRGTDPTLRLRIQQLNPADTTQLAASNYRDNTMYNVKSQWGTALVNPQNVYSMLSSAAGYNYGNGMGALTTDKSPRQIFIPLADGQTKEETRNISAAEQTGKMMIYFALKNKLVAPNGSTPSSRHLFIDNGNGQYVVNARAFSQLTFNPETGQVVSVDNPESANVFNQVLTNTLDVLSGRPTNTGQSTWQLNSNKQTRPAVSAFKSPYRNFDNNELVDTYYTQALSWILAKMQTDRMPITFK